MSGWVKKGGVTDGVTWVPTPKQLGITIVTFKRLKRGSSSSSSSSKAKNKTHAHATNPCNPSTPKTTHKRTTHTHNSQSNPRGKATSSERCESRVLCSVCGPSGAPWVLNGCCINLYIYKSICTIGVYKCGPPLEQAQVVVLVLLKIIKNQYLNYAMKPIRKLKEETQGGWGW